MLFAHSETLISQSLTASQRPGAVWSAGRALSLLGRTGGAIWRYLEGVDSRASAEVRLLTAGWANADPELASQMRAASTFDAKSQAARADHEVRLLAAR